MATDRAAVKEVMCVYTLGGITSKVMEGEWTPQQRAHYMALANSHRTELIRAESEDGSFVTWTNPTTGYRIEQTAFRSPITNRERTEVYRYGKRRCQIPLNWLSYELELLSIDDLAVL
jgi:hypothetical protein